MQRMRTIAQTAAWIRARDPDSALTETAIRRLTVTGQLCSVRVGSKYLLDLDRVEEFLRGSQARPTTATGIRGIDV